MIKLTEEEKTKLKSLGLDDSDLQKIENAAMLMVKRNRWISAIIGLVAGFILGKLF